MRWQFRSTGLCIQMYELLAWLVAGGGWNSCGKERNGSKDMKFECVHEWYCHLYSIAYKFYIKQTSDGEGKKLKQKSEFVASWGWGRRWQKMVNGGWAYCRAFSFSFYLQPEYSHACANSHRKTCTLPTQMELMYTDTHTRPPPTPHWIKWRRRARTWDAALVFLDS